VPSPISDHHLSSSPLLSSPLVRVRAHTRPATAVSYPALHCMHLLCLNLVAVCVFPGLRHRHRRPARCCCFPEFPDWLVLLLGVTDGYCLLQSCVVVFPLFPLQVDSVGVSSTCCCSDPTPLLVPVGNANPKAWFRSSSFALATWPNYSICLAFYFTKSSINILSLSFVVCYS